MSVIECIDNDCVSFKKKITKQKYPKTKLHSLWLSHSSFYI